jgi:Protein of unknown function (DUF2628)
LQNLTLDVLFRFVPQCGIIAMLLAAIVLSAQVEVVMITVTVHEPPSPPSDRLDRAERLEFVKDGYNWVAAAWPPLWMLGQQLWWALTAYLLLAVGLSFALGAMGVSPAVVGLVFLGLHLLIGLEADTIRRWNLDRTGWQVVGTVVGRNLAECERRFFDDWLPQQPIIRVGALRTGTQRDDPRKPPNQGHSVGWRRVLGGWSAAPNLAKLPTERG